MFKTISSIFSKAGVQEPIVLTPALLNKRHTLCNDLVKAYDVQLQLMKEVKENDLNILKYYLKLEPQYQRQSDDIKSFINTSALSETPLSEEKFKHLLNPQLNETIAELENINSQIQMDDLLALDKAYNEKLNTFFKHFHNNRIAVSYSLKEYLSETSLVKSLKAVDIINSSIKTTSTVLGLNNYPVPRFNINPISDSDLEVTCIPPHIIHIMFEMFKNASLPSLQQGKAISVNVYKNSKGTNSDSGASENPATKLFSLNNYLQSSPGQEFVTLEIKDEGGGMPNSLLSKIWHFHYTTSSDSDRDPIHGFGMGLPLCKVFAEFNDGTLILENTEGEGVCIKITLPAAYL